MDAWVLEKQFGLENLVLRARGSAPLAPGAVRVQLSGWALNYRDHLVVEGSYNPRVSLPLVPGSDAAGTVIEISDDVARFAVGDRVIPMLASGWVSGPPTRDNIRDTLGCPKDGVFQREVVLPAADLVKAPEGLSTIEAATLPCAALTAWNALRLGGVSAGDYVLIEGTGGVSIFALQFAVAMKAHAIVTSKSDQKLARAKALGAFATLNYQQEKDWGKAAREISGGEGVKCTIDVGGSRTLSQAVRATRPGGSIAVIGVLSGSTAEVSLVQLMMHQLRLQGIFVGSRDSLEDMNQFIEASTLRPVIDEQIPFDRLPEALEKLPRGAHFGKICIHE